MSSAAVAYALGLSGCGAAAGDGDDLRGPLLGQPPPGLEARVFAPGVVSVQGRYEYAVSFSPDGNLLLFSAEGPEGGASVFLSRVEDGAWSTPAPLSLSAGARKHEMEAFFSPDGTSVFFAAYDEGMDVRPWRIDISAEGWRNPRPLGEPLNRDPAFYPVPAADGALYFTNLATRSVDRAVLAGDRVEKVEPVGLEGGGHAYPSPDGSFIVADSASLGSSGQRDLFVAFRREDGTWGPLRDLGPAVNTGHSETCPSLSPDGTLLFFSRYDEPGGLSDIYWVSAEVVEQARQRRR